MPITKSAIKAMKQSRKANERNKAVKANFRLKVKEVKKDLAGEAKDVAALASKAMQAIDKASKNGVIHKKTAARRKSRLAKVITKTLGKTIELASVKAKTEKPAAKKTTAKNTKKKEA